MRKEAYRMKSNYFNLSILILVIIIFGAASCNLNTALQPPTPDLLATSVHQTASELFSQMEQTDESMNGNTSPDSSETPVGEIQPTDTIPPSPTAEPTETPVIEDNRILFAPGTTFATIRGEIEKDKTKEYILQIGQGQLLSVFVESDGKSPVLAIKTAEGKEILPASSGFTWYLTSVPKSQDYIVTIVAPDKNTNYILHVSTPIDVEFDTGSTSKTFQGIIEADDIVEFRAYALEGQKATVTLNSISGQASLHIYGMVDLVNYVESDSGLTTWTAILPESQNYIIKVLANNYPTEFTLKIEFLNP
jgi:hypothetical protein